MTTPAPRRRWHRPSPSVAISLLALFVALGGTSFAAVDAVLPKNSVGSVQLKAGAVTNAKLAADAVTAAKVKDGSLGKAELAPGTLPAAGPGGQVWASGFLKQDGVLSPGARNIASVTHPATGQYHLDFETPAAGSCSAVTQVFSYLILDTNEQVPGSSRLAISNTYLEVDTVGPDFLPADRGFDFVVIC